ncbi:NADPH-dependent 2,4-dienoyl-CoA reductase/sulfur reductase-like enzyme [Methylovorus glucosotrophus]|uniref:NAD(P)/FAD-dependent oxidoreductase n=1 Tax=Methylovorus glucosotrophus TaxID=266009 RepID=UPI001331B4E5|nr:NAD(P)/FAD-dependent oxidoreductase [Methylovorus glucosotrophus]KAF0844514.1 NADPH-dependent 2,4-dienoyl-CoA reductase/sulfur reductase-like enzyme [Methylovorus glucosotrophus]
MIDRRNFLKLGSAAALLTGCSPLLRAAGRPKPRVVVVGGGYAGAAAAKYLKLWGGNAVDVVVVEPSSQFVSCPLSNLVLGGSKTIDDLTFSYAALKKNHDLQWVRDSVVAIDPEHKKLILGRSDFGYDKLILAPGVDFIYDALPGLESDAARKQVPHAWKAGEQTVNLRRQLESMPDDGVFVMSIPKAPYRCPPGPYERVCQVAFYFKQHKPKARIIVLDANPEIVSKKALFTKAWADLYPGMIEYRPNSVVVEVDVAGHTLMTEFDSIKGDVLNVIPPQRAGIPAQLAQANNIDKRWCEVDFLTYESMVVPHVHIIGDAVSAALPKSAHMATSQARVCANAVLAALTEQPIDTSPVFANTCYSYVSDHMAMHVANVYRYNQAKKIMLSAEGGGVSDAPSELEADYARYWAQNIWSDVLT